MKRSFLLMLVLLIAVQASSQPSFIPPIRKDHPRLFFNQDTWPEVERRAKGPSREYLDALLRAVDKITDNPVAARTGPLQRNDQVKVMEDGTKLSHYAADIKPIKEFGYQAAQAALAWRFTREDKYLQKAKKLLRVSVDAYTEATNNRRPVNWYSTNRINALCAYDWIYEALTDEERASYIVPLVEHVKLIQPEAGLNIPRTSGGHKGTGFYGTRSLYWYAGVAAYGDGFCDEEAKRQLETGYKLFIEVCQHRNDTAGDDGALLSASIGYATGFYPYAHFNFFHTHISATGINIAKNYSSMPLLPNWIWWVWIRDSDDPQYIRHSGCGDDYHSQNTLTAKRLYEHLLQYWHFYKDADPAAGELTKALMNYAPKGKLGADFPAHPFILDINPYSSLDADIKLRESSCKARHFETLGQIYMRSGWNETDTYCCFTAGASLKQHKHYDENNFAIYKGDHLALDTGSRGDSDNLNLRYYFAQSVAHNVVLIHQPGEKIPGYWGPESDDPAININYGGMVKNSGANILAFETGDDFSYVASDATECYGAKCKEAVRQFVYIYPDYFIVYDRVTSSDPSYEKQWLLHTQNKPRVKKNVLKADGTGGRLFCQTLLPQNAEVELIGGPGKEFWVRDRNYPLSDKSMEKYNKSAEKTGRGPYLGGWRMELSPSDVSDRARFLNVLTAATPNRKAPLKVKYVNSEGKDGVTFSLEGKTYTFMFNTDGEVGGTVTIDNVTRPLISEVTPQKGVIW